MFFLFAIFTKFPKKIANKLTPRSLNSKNMLPVKRYAIFGSIRIVFSYFKKLQAVSKCGFHPSFLDLALLPQPLHQMKHYKVMEQKHYCYSWMHFLHRSFSLYFGLNINPNSTFRKLLGLPTKSTQNSCPGANPFPPRAIPLFRNTTRLVLSIWPSRNLGWHCVHTSASSHGAS